jgi:hypothetical protein
MGTELTDQFTFNPSNEVETYDPYPARGIIPLSDSYSSDKYTPPTYPETRTGWVVNGTPTWQYGDWVPPGGPQTDAWNARFNVDRAIPTSGYGTGSQRTSSGSTVGSSSGAPITPTFNYPTNQPAPYVAPAYTPPAWDKRKIAYETQKAASPYVSEIRRAIRQAISRSNVSGNPILSRYESGAAMDSAGNAFGKVVGQAGDVGLKNYSAEYGRDLNAYNVNYQSQNQAAIANYQQQLAMFNQALAAYYKSPALSGSVANTVNNNSPALSNADWTRKYYG